MVIETLREKVMVFCYLNGSIKYGADGVYYEGSILKKITVMRKTSLSTLLDRLYQIFGLDKQRSKLKIFGRYPVAVVGSPDLFTYAHLPVVNDTSLETMLEVPSHHPSINNVDLYMEAKPTSDDVIDPAVCLSPLENPSSSLKRQRTQHERMDTISGSDGCLVKVVNSGVLKPCLLPRLWIDDDHDMHVGLCFKDRDELKKAVDWWSIKRRRKCIVRETEKDMYMFECVRWKCKWSLCAARMEKHGLVEITRNTAPHTCSPKDFEAKFLEDEIERVVRVHPTLSIAELKNWWKRKNGYKLETAEMKEAKKKAIKRVFGDEDQSFRVMPKLMSAFHSSNGLLVDWLYDCFPNPEFASFRAVFWAFSQSIKGFQHCRPLIIVDSKDLNGKYPMKFMIASGVDAANDFFPLAFAVTKELSTDIWRWFLTGIREKVTQRKGLCLISSSHPDILTVINESGSQWQEPWAYHRLCLDHVSTEFSHIFSGDNLGSPVWSAGSTSQKDAFDSYMKEIEKRNPEARRLLAQTPPHQWALAHDSGLRFGVMELEPEDMFPVCTDLQYYTTADVMLMFDDLRSSFGKSLSSSRCSLNRGELYTKPVMDRFEEFMTDSITYVITPLERDSFKVSESSKKEEWIVQLNDSTCTCGKFQSYKFPCLHALAVCEKLKINPLQYVDDCYSVERWCKTYAATFSPVPEVSAWPEASGVPTLFPPSPPN
ncbi:uncharacterized protein LOC110230918 isoform X1 [Arabidopsis lyrata subsp. lyrata]|uniref:uncharacterized protein LOC110230918 isoform X1 n=1 Tax=Arabidopsis lyrata subsp. lyrata TaxID=81972 RepID=UPI000A29C967|nr:uncharacterized protein LOC110230918 isoform X1 [Arabidopsis lyrata subsp. lyrata]|eukprot:XP_020890824.1 uncharacterized protein LOC110230918 isoform X1 [Arabidopsis lyrata subsp. lyrata]